MIRTDWIKGEIRMKLSFYPMQEKEALVESVQNTVIRNYLTCNDPIYVTREEVEQVINTMVNDREVHEAWLTVSGALVGWYILHLNANISVMM